ncbi:MAG: hydroxyacid dehydrogenase [Myxococcales bacterium]|nr:hydroxyacid dehydrogenase [Myxococcales bacterium]
MSRILISDKLAPECRAVFDKAGFDVTVKTGMNPKELAKEIGSYDGLVVRSASKARGDAFWTAAQKLKVVGRAGTGVDNIDLAAATDNGTWVMNTPGGNNVSAAEHAISLMLSLARHVPQASAEVTGGGWGKSKYKGVEVTDKTLAVIGLGAIGRIVADRGLGLRMNVVAFDPFVSQADAPAGVTIGELKDVLAQADFVSLHVPLNAHTTGLIDAEKLGWMKAGARLIHAARGGIVVEKDLLGALQSGHLAGAALDVFEVEPSSADNPLFALTNVIATPHLGASTHEAQVRVAVMVANQIVALLRDGEIIHNVNQLPS